MRNFVPVGLYQMSFYVFPLVIVLGCGKYRSVFESTAS